MNKTLRERLVIFLSAFLSIIVITYYTEIKFYHSSLDYIEQVRHWRPVPLVAILHFFSYSGDVDVWWIIAFVIWGFSKNQLRTYFINLFIFQGSTYVFIIFLVKLLFHSGRPYYERIELGDMTLHEMTSAEFGNPSGHSLSAIANPLFMYLYFTQIHYKEYYDKLTTRKNVYLLMVISYALGVAYSRIYTGRHTVD